MMNFKRDFVLLKRFKKKKKSVLQDVCHCVSGAMVGNAIGEMGVYTCLQSNRGKKPNLITRETDERLERGFVRSLVFWDAEVLWRCAF